jgi:hypothetical protein
VHILYVRAWVDLSAGDKVRQVVYECDLTGRFSVASPLAVAISVSEPLPLFGLSRRTTDFFFSRA